MYDQKVAIDDKRSMRRSLAYLRESNKWIKGTIDGWQLIHVALAAVCELDPDSWVYSANKVNLKPSTRVGFQDWCKRISHYLQGGESSFKPEIVRDSYALLSPFWHGMEPDEKKLAISIVKSHESTFTTACVKEMIERAHVPITEMQNMRVAIELALKDPSHLERTKPDSTPREVSTEVLQAQASVVDVTSGLISFQVHPKAADGVPLMSGVALFDHMIKMSRRSVPLGTDLMPSRSLDVEYTEQQQRIINPRTIDYAMHEIAKHAHGEGAKQAMALALTLNPHPHPLRMPIQHDTTLSVHPLTLTHTGNGQAQARQSRLHQGRVRLGQRPRAHPALGQPTRAHQVASGHFQGALRHESRPNIA